MKDQSERYTANGNEQAEDTLLNLEPNVHKALLARLFDQSFNAIVVTDARPGPDGPEILAVNDAFCQMTGYSSNELLGRTPRILQGPETSQAVLDELVLCLKESGYFRGSTINYRKDGSAYNVEWNISPVTDEAGVVTHFVSIQQDISHLVGAVRTNQLLADALNSTQDGVMITDAQQRIVHVNHGFELLTGYTAHSLLGQTPRIMQSGKMGADFYQRLWQTLNKGDSFRGLFTDRHRAGHEVNFEQTITPLTNRDGHITNYVSVIKDMTERTAHEESLRQDAEYDALTSALTRKAGEKRLKNAGLMANNGLKGFSVILADIDYFKAFNDTWGHAMGDRVLRDVTIALCETVRASDSVIRWGGEEFVIVLPYTGIVDAANTAERCRVAVSRIDTGEVDSVSASFGVAELIVGESADQIVDRADRAMYQAKNTGRNRVCRA